MENACKWASNKVEVRGRELVGTSGKELEIAILDDGPGVEPDEVERLLERGTRLDSQVEGHGLGLAILHDLVTLYRGKLEIRGKGQLGGVEVVVSVPLS